MYKTISFFLGLLFSTTLLSQFDHEPVFQDLSGTVLLDALQDNYTPNTVLSFARSRDTLFSAVWAQNDSLRCVYTDYPRYINPNEDPTQTVFNDGQPNGINTEHSYPQSKGADSGNPKADMHHLFPTRVDVNGTRASLPFAEIPDNQTDSWFYNDIKTSSIPSSGIDNYSEANNQGFEVREDFKGNIARAIFYFYTMYKSQADSADPNFFSIQQETLCDWHFEDVVDEQEWINTHKIAEYQDGKVNPFILDCSLASRAYCEEISTACALVNVADLNVEDYITLSPNPVHSNLEIKIAEQLKIEGLHILNSEGLKIEELDNDQSTFDIGNIQPGFYFLRIKSNYGVMVLKFAKF